MEKINSTWIKDPSVKKLKHKRIKKNKEKQLCDYGVRNPYIRTKMLKSHIKMIDKMQYVRI